MDNTFKVSILNYQRVKKASLEFIPGLNLLVGESNQGKSALGIRSLETAIYNIPREDHITIGETKSVVGIRYNGHEVIWRRDKESSSQVTYRIDGKIYQKLGRGQPDEVASALGIRELEVNDKKFRLNFSKQMSYPFLLDSTPSDMFKFIAQSSGEDNLVEVLKQMKKDVNEISSSVKAHEEAQKVLGESISTLESKFKSIEGKRQYCDEVLSLDSKVKELSTLREKIDTYNKCKNAVEKMNNSLSYFKDIFNDINSSVALIESKMSILNNLRVINDRYYDNNRNLFQLELDLTKYDSILRKYLKLDDYYEKLKSQESNGIKLLDLSSTLSRYKAINANIADDNKSLSTLSANEDRYSKFIEVIGKVLSIKEGKEQDLQYLQDTVSKCSELQLSINSYNAEISYLNEVIDNCSKEIEDIGVCPYCGSVLTGGSHDKH